MTCHRCNDERWVCELHHDQPSPHRDCDGAGAPCPDCNDRGGRPELPDGWQSIAATDDRD